MIIGIAAALGGLGAVASALATNWTLMAFFIVLTIFVTGMIYMLYEVPDGETCSPDVDDSNVATWQMQTGLCQPASCANPGSQFILPKTGSLIKTCATPVSLPKDFDKQMSNSYNFLSSSNLISNSIVSSDNVCAYQCDTTTNCQIAAYDSNGMCYLLLSDETSNPKNTGPQIEFLVRKAK